MNFSVGVWEYEGVGEDTPILPHLPFHSNANFWSGISNSSSV